MYYRQQFKSPAKTYQILSSLNGNYGNSNKAYYEDLMLKARGKISQ